MAEKPRKQKTKNGPRKRRRSLSPQDPRQMLLDVALDLFARHGFDGVSTNMIASAANLSQPVIYYHFASKDDLWRCAIGALMRDLGRHYPRIGDELKDLDPVNQLKVMARRFIQMSFSDPRLSQIIILESIARNERLDWLAAAYLNAGFSDFDKAIIKGIEAGLIKNMPVYVLTNTLIAACSLTFCVSPLIKKVYDVDVSQQARLSELTDSIVDIIFNGLIADPPNK